MKVIIIKLLTYLVGGVFLSVEFRHCDCEEWPEKEYMCYSSNRVVTK